MFNTVSNRVRVAAGAVLFAVLTAGCLPLEPGPMVGTPPASPWLNRVNEYRTQSGLAPVVENSLWSAQAQRHSCYMLKNGIAHDEVPGLPGYTPDGDIAGNSGNVAVSSSVATTGPDHVDLWMSGPFHAIGMLRPGWTTTGFGDCIDTTTSPYRSGGTLDVIRGLDSSRQSAAPVLFPGNGATTQLYRFVAESPSPVQQCGWTGSAGLPLIALMPQANSSASSTLTGPGGPIETCTLHRNNLTDSTARAIVSGDNAVVVVPRVPLDNGVHTATVTTNTGSVSWSFTVAKPASSKTFNVKTSTIADVGQPLRFTPVAPVRLHDTRTTFGGFSTLQAGSTTRFPIVGAEAATLNVTAVNAASAGFLTVWDCGPRPATSSLNFQPGGAFAANVVTRLDASSACVYAHSTVDVVIDLNGTNQATSGLFYQPASPARAYDSRTIGQPLQPREVRRVQVAAPGVPAAQVNVVAVAPPTNGFVTLWDCAGAAPNVSNLNYTTSNTRANTATVKLDASGAMCAMSSAAIDLVVDVNGTFNATSGFGFQPNTPTRLFDSRSESLQQRIGGNVTVVDVGAAVGQLSAATVTATVVGAWQPGFLTVWDCTASVPTVSTLNYPGDGSATPNTSTVRVSTSGLLCLRSHTDAHIIVDLVGHY